MYVLKYILKYESVGYYNHGSVTLLPELMKSNEKLGLSDDKWAG